ncbi:hypothetical protein [Pinibacter aurantiacus]|uniref:Uncharacterized protein n=1 Tax=Pinibacter aurantiacus TaxID=2851599 RepID=A0A9E2SEP9_9BACT|nr:hypothetical protein [Pinibacter aurantiacus]MBV4359744.1 hypothetical protein [Pinibacter aurantiacus]
MLQQASSEIRMNEDHKGLLVEKLQWSKRTIFSRYACFYGAVIFILALLLNKVKHLSDISMYGWEIISAFSLPFLSIFTFFLVRDIRRDVIPLKKDISCAKCWQHHFVAQKYYHALIKKYLLFYPGKEDEYIEVSPEDFDKLIEGEYLNLVTSQSDEIICLQRDNGEIIRAFDFSFK